ncbi:hypothetical protein [Leifsonia sp. LS-T14]|uniref:hypothetical protein n=1 Tax=unclassified Leifsonia TaxID=2663824 RepID=UPI0035A6DF53
MSLAKSLLPALAVPALTVCALAVGVLTGCSTSTSTSQVTTTAGPKMGWSFSVGGEASVFDSLPQDIPYLTSYSESKATGDQATGHFQLALKTRSTDAVQDAANKLTQAGFTSLGKSVYSSSTWKVTLEGTGGQVKYTIARNG